MMHLVLGTLCCLSCSMPLIHHATDTVLAETYTFFNCTCFQDSVHTTHTSCDHFFFTLLCVRMACVTFFIPFHPGHVSVHAVADRDRWAKDQGVGSGPPGGACGCSSCAASHPCWSAGWATCCPGSLKGVTPRAWPRPSPSSVWRVTSIWSSVRL